jgi:hypothetical protein
MIVCTSSYGFSVRKGLTAASVDDTVATGVVQVAQRILWRFVALLARHLQYRHLVSQRRHYFLEHHVQRCHQADFHIARGGAGRLQDRGRHPVRVKLGRGQLGLAVEIVARSAAQPPGPGVLSARPGGRCVRARAW